MKKVIALIVMVIVAALAAPISSAFADTSNRPYAGQTDWHQVAPFGLQGSQSWVSLDQRQKQYAIEVVQGAQALGLPPYAAVIAVATALQESKFVNYTDAVDHDSLGIFQQRPSCGWGTDQQIEDPAYAARSFFKALEQTDYTHMSLTDAAQSVQHSAFGTRYAQWQLEATRIVSDLSNGKM